MSRMIQLAIDPLRVGLQADGADIELVSVAETAVVVKLVVGPETCLDCILPKELLETILLSAVQEKAPGIARIDLVDPREMP
jgi:hypothetical protein